MFLHVDGRSRHGFCKIVSQCWVFIFTLMCHIVKMLGIKAWEYLWRHRLKKEINRCVSFPNAQIDADKCSSENRPSRCDQRTVIYFWRLGINATSLTVNTTQIVQIIYRHLWLRAIRSFLFSKQKSQQDLKKWKLSEAQTISFRVISWDLALLPASSSFSAARQYQPGGLFWRRASWPRRWNGHSPFPWNKGGNHVSC